MKEEEERGGSHLDQEQGEEMFFSCFFFPVSERLETCLNIGRREAVERVN